MEESLHSYEIDVKVCNGEWNARKKEKDLVFIRSNLLKVKGDVVGTMFCYGVIKKTTLSTAIPNRRRYNIPQKLL